MKSLVIKPRRSLRGEAFLLGDKSIAHRAAILASLSEGRTTIDNFPANKDCLSTLSVLKKLGVEIKIAPKKTNTFSLGVTIRGKGLKGLRKPSSPIVIEESGTTFRLFLGVLAGQDFEVKLASGASLSKRPMHRVTYPLRLMGAEIHARNKAREEYPPVTIHGGALKPVTYRVPVASAQVKSAILLAGLFADGRTAVIEPIQTRDHTERLLRQFRAGIKINANTIAVKGMRPLVSPGRIFVPGDISSAAFLVTLASLIPDAKVAIRNVSLNPTRDGILRVLKRMGARIEIHNAKRIKRAAKVYEPIGDLIVRGSVLRGTTVTKGEIPSLIDELPVLMVAAAFARGKTVLKGVGELRVKETDRIRSMSENLQRMGADIKVSGARGKENIVIMGRSTLRGAQVRSFGDHRTAMSMIVAGLTASGETSLDDISCISKSSPDFMSTLKALLR